ncbi:MAG TPA: glycosyltransferase family 2 protein, partial [Casimicrobiaceae bacterium]|nr:glycosyltransferase family 2 protein [Casimicrobiaceae bacterium]
MLPSSLQVSVVTYQPDLPLLERTLDTLGIAIEAAQDARVLKTVHLALIDNSGDRGIAERVIELGRARFADQAVHVMFLHGHANIGYGAAHNLVLHGTGADYHLVLNPDAELAADALVNGVGWLDAHPEVGALAPAVVDADGNRQYLCKRYPAVLDLALRGFAPRAVQRLFAQRLARYEMRDVVDVDPPRDAIGVPVMSGAFV